MALLLSCTQVCSDIYKNSATLVSKWSAKVEIANTFYWEIYLTFLHEKFLPQIGTQAALQIFPAGTLTWSAFERMKPKTLRMSQRCSYNSSLLWNFHKHVNRFLLPGSFFQVATTTLVFSTSLWIKMYAQTIIASKKYGKMRQCSWSETIFLRKHCETGDLTCPWSLSCPCPAKQVLLHPNTLIKRRTVNYLLLILSYPRLHLEDSYKLMLVRTYVCVRLKSLLLGICSLFFLSFFKKNLEQWYLELKKNPGNNKTLRNILCCPKMGKMGPKCAKTALKIFERVCH